MRPWSSAISPASADPVLADQVNQLGRMDAVIHNAGVYGDSDRHPSPEGHPRVLAVNTLAPYLLTGLIQRPDRLIYLTSDMHVSGDDSLHDLDWSSRRWNGTQAYCDSKLFVTALALARRWPNAANQRKSPRSDDERSIYYLSLSDQISARIDRP